MQPDADLAAIGRLIGDPNRARILQVLMGGIPQSGSALAEATGISRSLASAHLKKLTAGYAGLDAWLGLDFGRLKAERGLPFRSGTVLYPAASSRPVRARTGTSHPNSPHVGQEARRNPQQ
jgi:Bacterial regulatory protein, arsR family